MCALFEVASACVTCVERGVCGGWLLCLQWDIIPVVCAAFFLHCEWKTLSNVSYMKGDDGSGLLGVSQVGMTEERWPQARVLLNHQAHARMRRPSPRSCSLKKESHFMFTPRTSPRARASRLGL